MTQPLLLALTAPSGAGKDTAAHYLAEQYAFIPIAFADPLRDMLAALLTHVGECDGWLTSAALKQQPVPVIGHSYRQLARSLGTAWGRCALDAELWIRIAEHRVRQALQGGDNVVITDLRHWNELRWLLRQRGTLVALTRDGTRYHTLDHSSEHEAAEVAALADHTLTNNSTVSHLHDQLDVLMDRLRSGKASAA